MSSKGSENQEETTNNVDKAAEKLENLSKKVSESINGTPGSAVTMADMVAGGVTSAAGAPKESEEKKDDGKLSN